MHGRSLGPRAALIGPMRFRFVETASVASDGLVSFDRSASEPERNKVWLGQRLLGRALAVPFNYAELYRDPEAARRGEFDPDELLAKTTCASNAVRIKTNSPSLTSAAGRFTVSNGEKLNRLTP
jgi:hypothetical protein